MRADKRMRLWFLLDEYLSYTFFLSILKKVDDKDDDDTDEKEQDRLAKQFSRRARMQRLIEQHGEDEEFSQLRLIDEDETTRLELKMMKVRTSIRRIHVCSIVLPCSSPALPSLLQSVSRKSRDISTSTSSRSASRSGSDSQEGSAFFATATSSKRSCSLALGTSSLSLALQASRASKKKKTSFLGGVGSSKEMSTSVHKCLSMGHVVFNKGGDSQLSKGGQQSFSRSNLGSSSRQKEKRKRETMQKSTSLWSAVSANGFKKRRS